ncbi:MAG: hypothetical protein JW891_05050 [Candidatus Lokiarchaeota archaeon]|nr:hypothetical protein [Candidatus Lokiarchaeota archaeon]
MTTIIISEKNKAARAIAEALGQVQVIKKSKYIYIYNVIDKDIVVIPLRGHLQEHRNTPDFSNWKYPAPRNIITNPSAIKKYLIRGLSPYMKVLKEIALNSDHCVIGTDADIEGCNIGIMDALPYVLKSRPSIKISQLWISSLQPNEIQSKFNNLISPKYFWAESGEARSIIDAFIGFSATREVSNSLKQALQQFGVNWTSIGRVQTSTLYLLYLKEKEIEEFVPEKYFVIDAILIAKNSSFKAHHKANPFSKNNETVARAIYEKIKEEKLAIITNFNQNKVNRKPPSPLNTNKALILLTKTLKISAKQAMDTMNDLYLEKIISYPRTESDIYKNNFDHLTILTKFTLHSIYGKYTKTQLTNKRVIPTKGKKDEGDHPPITPLESIELNDKRLSGGFRTKVYNTLSRHYLALFGEEATESRQDLDLLIKDEPFKAQIVSLIHLGFFEIAPFLKPHYDLEIQIEGNTIPVQNIELFEKETTPPPRYTDPTLLKLMEKHGLGTKATRPQIIQTMLSRKVIRKEKNKFLVTDLGVFLMQILVQVWLPFLKPSFTKRVEDKLKQIKEGQRKMNDVIEEVRKEFLMLFDNFLSAKEEFQKILPEIEQKKNTYNNYNPSERFKLTVGKCPTCIQSQMKFINLKNKRFLACTDNACKTYLPLPKKGRATMLETQCSICGFDVFKISTQNNGKAFNYYLCPKCWKEGLESRSGKGFCSQCKDYSIENNKCVKSKK